MNKTRLPEYYGYKISGLYLVEPSPNGRYIGGVVLEPVYQSEPDLTLWRIKEPGSNTCLNKDGLWQLEPMPSSRDEEFFRDCRFVTMFEALVTWEKFNGVD